MGRNERHAIPEHAELFGGTVADAHAWQFNWGSFAWTEKARDTLSLMPSLLPPDEDCRTSELITSGEPAWDPQVHIKLASPQEMSAAVPDIYGMDGRSQPHPSSVTVGLYFYRDMPHTPIHEIEAADSGRPYINPMVACLAEMASRKAAEGVEAWHTETREMHLNRVRKIVKAVGITAATGLFAGLSFAARQPADGMIAGSIIGLADLAIIRFLGDTHKSMAATRARISQEKARSYTRIVQQDIYRIFTEIYTPQQQGPAES